MVFANAAISQDIFVMRQLIYFLIKTHAVNSPYNAIMINNYTKYGNRQFHVFHSIIKTSIHQVVVT